VTLSDVERDARIATFDKRDLSQSCPAVDSIDMDCCVVAMQSPSLLTDGCAITKPLD